jgi:hypothetical protein
MKPVKTLSVFVFLALAVQAAPTKGLQLVLLQCWRDASVDRLLSVLSRPNAPAEIEISSSPFLDTACYLRGESEGRQLPAAERRQARFHNLLRVINGIPAPRKVRVTIHVGALHESGPGSSLDEWMAIVWTHVIAPYEADGRVSFHISPSLEDTYTHDEFKTALNRLMARLDANRVRTLVASSRFAFRRSPIKLDSAHTNLKYTSHRAFSPAVSIPVTYEFHGTSPRSNYIGWSNDGYLVYYAQNENHSSHGESILDDHPKISLATFNSRRMNGAKLLWRPAFNLFEKRVSNGRVSYYRNGKRTDTAAGKVDAVELDGLVRFLLP